MTIHPPMLYSGYVAFTIPFAFAIGALVTRRSTRLDPRHPPLRADRLALPRHRHPARRPLVLLRARLGRLLGLGPGRERRADAVADRHRVPALDHGPGAAGDAEGLERCLSSRPSRWRCWGRSWCAPASWSRSTPSATSPSAPTARADRGGRDRLGGSDRLPAGRPALRAADRLAGLARGGLPDQQPAADRRSRGDLLGHLLPADLRAVHRRQGLARRALVRPLHDAAGDPAGPVHRHRPLLAWRRVSWASARRVFL